MTVLKIVFPILKYSKSRVLRWIIAFVQFKVRIGNCTKLIFHSKTHNNACFEVEYHICVTSSQSWHLHKSDFLSQNTQNEVFCCRIFHLRNLESELTVAQTGFSTVNTKKDVFCYRLSHLCNLKTELALTQSWFSSVKCTKRGVLL